MYLPAWCRLRNAVRVFAVHRIRAVEVLPDEVARMEPTRRSIERAFRVWYRDKVEHVVVHFTGRAAGEIRERIWHTSQRLDETITGEVTLHLDVSAPEELERWLLGYGPEALVLEPARLAEQIHQLHVRAAGNGLVLKASEPRLPPRLIKRMTASRATRSRGVS